MKEKEYYENKIIEKIKKIEKIEILVYINRLIENVLNNARII